MFNILVKIFGICLLALVFAILLFYSKLIAFGFIVGFMVGFLLTLIIKWKGEN